MTGINPKNYSAALDEIYRLRSVLAYEARIIEAHLDLATFPKSRRGIAREQVTRTRAAVVGDTDTAYRSIDSGKMQRLIRDAGGSGTLTRWEWEAEVADRLAWSDPR